MVKIITITCMEDIEEIRVSQTVYKDSKDMRMEVY